MCMPSVSAWSLFTQPPTLSAIALRRLGFTEVSRGAHRPPDVPLGHRLRPGSPCVFSTTVGSDHPFPGGAACSDRCELRLANGADPCRSGSLCGCIPQVQS
jgi:hypothetical protein